MKNLKFGVEGANIEQDTATWKFIRDAFQKPFVLYR